MSVIAKMSVIAVRDFGESGLAELQCVCADELMPGCRPEAKQYENYTFQQASPSGDAKVSLPKDIKFRTSEELYLIFIESKQCPPFPNALAVVKARCASITDYGGTSKRVEISGGLEYVYERREYKRDHPLQVTNFTGYIMIDNPKASIQFKAGKEGYWIGIYRCSDMTMAEALDFAHSTTKPKEPDKIETMIDEMRAKH